MLASKLPTTVYAALLEEKTKGSYFRFRFQLFANLLYLKREMKQCVLVLLLSLKEAHVVFSLSIYTALSQGYDAAWVLFSNVYLTFHYIFAHFFSPPSLFYVVFYFLMIGTSPCRSLSLSLSLYVCGVHTHTPIFLFSNTSILTYLTCKTNPISVKVSSIIVTGHIQYTS